MVIPSITVPTPSPKFPFPCACCQQCHEVPLARCDLHPAQCEGWIDMTCSCLERLFSLSLPPSLSLPLSHHDTMPAAAAAAAAEEEDAPPRTHRSNSQ